MKKNKTNKLEKILKSLKKSDALFVIDLIMDSYETGALQNENESLKKTLSTLTTKSKNYKAKAKEKISLYKSSSEVLHDLENWLDAQQNSWEQVKDAGTIDKRNILQIQSILDDVQKKIDAFKKEKLIDKDK